VDDSALRRGTGKGVARQPFGVQERVSPLLTTEEAAEALAVSVRTVKNLMFDGHLPFIKIGRATRIDRADLDAYVAQNRRKHRYPLRRAN
jgi:excisionase family DNA binding protein